MHGGSSRQLTCFGEHIKLSVDVQNHIVRRRRWRRFDRILRRRGEESSTAER
jgi:hypothetical protein